MRKRFTWGFGTEVLRFFTPRRDGRGPRARPRPRPLPPRAPATARTSAPSRAAAARWGPSDSSSPTACGDGVHGCRAGEHATGAGALEAAPHQRLVGLVVHRQHEHRQVVGQRLHRRAVAAVADEQGRAGHQLGVRHEPVHLDAGGTPQVGGVDAAGPVVTTTRAGQAGASVDHPLQHVRHAREAEGAEADEHRRLLRRPGARQVTTGPTWRSVGCGRHGVELGQRGHHPHRRVAQRAARAQAAQPAAPGRAGPRSAPWR